MKEIIDILRQQVILLMSLKKQAEEHREVLKVANPRETNRIGREIERTMIKLAELMKRQQQLVGDMEVLAWLQAQPETPEREMAEKLLDKLWSLLLDTKVVSIGNRELLKRNIEFIDYNVNVMTQTSAGVTYGAPQGSGGGAVQGRKMFEAGV